MCQKCYLPRRTQPEMERMGERKILVEKYTGRVEEIGK
jgi:hypothetical protein